MKIRKLFSATIASLALGLSTSFAADTKVGFVYVGPINDGGWTQIHHENALVMKVDFGHGVFMPVAGWGFPRIPPFMTVVDRLANRTIPFIVPYIH